MKSLENKARPREEGQEGECVKAIHLQKKKDKSRECDESLNKRQKPMTLEKWEWVEAAIWTEHMLAASATRSRKHSSRNKGQSPNLKPCISEPIPMRKLPTGEPCAGKPPARFGGRGGLRPFPTPISSPQDSLREKSHFVRHS